VSTPPVRRYDLDLLRAFAMMLGIGLHTALATLSLPGMSIEGPLGWFAAGVHGFRMPLFFLISGFFTAMLWTRRGPRGLLRDRSRRIALPLAVGLVTIVPLLFLLGYLGTLAPVDLQPTGLYAPPQRQGVWIELGHLWFLWYLFLLVLAYIPLARVIALSAPVLIWLLPVAAIVPQYFMADEFGASTATGIVPRWEIITYYAVFFVFGASLFDLPRRRGGQRIDVLGRSWPLLLTVGLLIVFPMALYATFITQDRAAASVLQVVYAWCIAIGLIGVVRILPRLDRPWVRYSSDASYWMYLAHLPLVLLIVPWIGALALPWPATFIVSALLVTVILLWTYDRYIRYGSVGRLLNGPRTRPATTADANSEP